MKGKNMRVKAVILFIILISICMITKAQNIERKDVDPKYKWNLSELYASESDWLKAKDNIQKNIDKVVQYKGKLGQSSESFLNGTKNYFDLMKELNRLSDYASRISDEDLNNSHNQSLVQQATALTTEISEKTAFISPEILKI
ncbi:MAG: hypothetical protein ACM3MI_03705, partial [Clostridiales bacterium]